MWQTMASKDKLANNMAFSINNDNLSYLLEWMSWKVEESRHNVRFEGDDFLSWIILDGIVQCLAKGMHVVILNMGLLFRDAVVKT